MKSWLELARNARGAGNPATAIAHLSSLFTQLQQLEEFPPFPAGCGEADALLDELGRSLHESVASARPADGPLHGDLILGTFLYVEGGHTALIRDLAASLPHPPAALWLTMQHPFAPLGLKAGAMERTGMSGMARLFDGGDPWSCARGLVEALMALKPSRVFLLHHPHDCVAVVAAAAASAMGSSLCLLHHADSAPTSGLFLPGARIVDFTPRACAFSRSMLGLKSSYLPLTCPDPGREERPFPAAGSLTTALSGNADKVGAMDNPTYPELVARVLSVTGGTHVHIGPLPPARLKGIAAHLRKKGVARERFVWVESAGSLVEALRRYRVDLVFNTYPRGGARTAVEAMAAGIPMLWHSPAPEFDAVRCQMRYPGAPLWRSVEDLERLLTRCDGRWLKAQSEAARSRYEEMHHPRKWKEFFLDLESRGNEELPGGFSALLLTNDILMHALERRRVAQEQRMASRRLSSRLRRLFGLKK